MVAPRGGSGFASVMVSSGGYAAAAATQRSAADHALALIPEAIDGVALADSGPTVMIADFGAADGANSVEPIRRALTAIRARAPRRWIVAVHTDIVGNDFAALAATLESSADRYDRDDDSVLPLMAARSLYGRVVPTGSLAFGWCASTLHWLSRPGRPVSDHFFIHRSGDSAAAADYAAQSAQDWRDFLAARAAELMPGAGIVAVDVARGDDGRTGAEALFDALNAAAEHCRDDGVLSAAEFAGLMYPTWFRSEAEIRAEFQPTFSAAGGEKLALTEVRLVTQPDPFRGIGDADRYARAQVDFLRGFLEPSFAAVLDPGHRRVALTTLWEQLRAKIAADPAAVTPEYRLMVLRLQRLA